MQGLEPLKKRLVCVWFCDSVPRTDDVARWFARFGALRVVDRRKDKGRFRLEFWSAAAALRVCFPRCVDD